MYKVVLFHLLKLDQTLINEVPRVVFSMGEGWARQLLGNLSSEPDFIVQEKP